jgi:hypothetical protein
MKNPRGPIKGKLEGRKNPSKNRHGTAISMLTEHAQLRKRIAELDLWLRELDRNRFDYDHKDRWRQTKRRRRHGTGGCDAGQSLNGRPAGPIEDCDE